MYCPYEDENSTQVPFCNYDVILISQSGNVEYNPVNIEKLFWEDKKLSLTKYFT